VCCIVTKQISILSDHLLYFGSHLSNKLDRDVLPQKNLAKVMPDFPGHWRSGHDLFQSVSHGDQFFAPPCRIQQKVDLS